MTCHLLYISVDEFSIPEHETSVIYYYIFQWVNSVFLVEHEMGHLPFEAEIQDIVKYGSFNFVTVAVNNTLTPHTLPPGKITYKTGK